MKNRLTAGIVAGTTAAALFGALNAAILTAAGQEYWALKGADWGDILFITHVSMIPKLWSPASYLF